jgi:hypothetical protein
VIGWQKPPHMHLVQLTAVLAVACLDEDCAQQPTNQADLNVLFLMFHLDQRCLDKAFWATAGRSAAALVVQNNKLPVQT